MRYVAKPSLQCNVLCVSMLQCYNVLCCKAFTAIQCVMLQSHHCNAMLWQLHLYQRTGKQPHPEGKEHLEVVLTVDSALFGCLDCLCQACTDVHTHLFGCYLGIWPFGEGCPPSKQILLDVCITPCIPDTLTVQHNCT